MTYLCMSLGPPRARRRARGAIPERAAQEVGDLADQLGHRSDGHPPRLHRRGRDRLKRQGATPITRAVSFARRPAAWKVYLAFGIVGLAAYLLTGSDELMTRSGSRPSSRSGSASAATGPPRGRPGSCSPPAAPPSGSATCPYTPALPGHEVPFPSLGDAAYVAMYPLMMGGLLLLVRSRTTAPTAAA